MSSKINEKGRVSDQWVRDNYNINAERSYVQDDELVIDLDNILNIKPDIKMSKSEFILLVSRAVSKYDTVKLSYGGEYLLYNNITRPETDKEVIDRLKTKEIKNRKDEAFERKEFKEYERLKAKFEQHSRISFTIK